MKSARIITKTSKRSKVLANGDPIIVHVLKTKASAKNSSSKPAPKISAQTQFKRIKEALAEVELIEAGKMKPASLKEALDEL